MKHIEEDGTTQAISITPIASDKPQKSKAALDLQVRMVTSSVNHGYASIEFDECKNSERKEELLEYMADCQHEYFVAREDLAEIDRYALADFETDLLMQKQKTIREFHA